jgi:hypothetical protein
MLGIARRSALSDPHRTFISLNSEAFSLTSHVSRVPQNEHAAANTAVLHWQRDPKNALSTCYPTTNQQVWLFQEHMALWPP